MEKPLISFVILSYNHELYISEAIYSALAQTYNPLEIVISDDCSSDNSFHIIKKICSSYVGPHSLLINCNPMNLGIGGNVNKAMDGCHGQLIVVAGGDDISLPERTEVIYEAWEKTGRRATSIFSNYFIIGKDGESQGLGGLRSAEGYYCQDLKHSGSESADTPHGSGRIRIFEGNIYDFLSKRQPVVNGCSHAWSRELFDQFGQLSSDLEDLVLTFRTLSIGQILYIDTPLLKYRRHGNNLSFLAERDDTLTFEHREERLRWVDEQTVKAYSNIIMDIDTLSQKNKISSSYHKQLITEAKRVRDFYDIERQMMDGGFLHKLLILMKFAKQGKIKLALRFAVRLLPKRIYRQLYIQRERWRTLCCLLQCR